MVFTDYTVEISIKLDALIERKHFFFLVKLKSIKDTYLSTQQPPTEQPSLKYRHKKHK